MEYVIKKVNFSLKKIYIIDLILAVVKRLKQDMNELVIITVLLAPYSATSQELSGAAKASLRLGLGHPL